MYSIEKQNESHMDVAKLNNMFTSKTDGKLNSLQQARRGVAAAAW